MVFYYPLRLQHYSLSGLTQGMAFLSLPYHALNSSRCDKRRHFYFVSDYHGSIALLLDFKWSCLIYQTACVM